MVERCWCAALLVRGADGSRRAAHTCMRGSRLSRGHRSRMGFKRRHVTSVCQCYTPVCAAAGAAWDSQDATRQASASATPMYVRPAAHQQRRAPAALHHLVPVGLRRAAALGLTGTRWAAPVGARRAAPVWRPVGSPSLAPGGQPNEHSPWPMHVDVHGSWASQSLIDAP